MTVGRSVVHDRLAPALHPRLRLDEGHGLVVAGKTAWIERNLPPSGVRVRLDQIRRETYEQYPLRLDGAKEERVWGEADWVFAEAVGAGHDVLVDSMALTGDWRRRILRVAHGASDRSPERIAVFLGTPVEMDLVRNRGREKRVLEDVVREMANYLQPPSKEEEFDSVIRVPPSRVQRHDRVDPEPHLGFGPAPSAKVPCGRCAAKRSYDVGLLLA